MSGCQCFCTHCISPRALWHSSYFWLFFFSSCIWDYFNKTSIGFISGISRDLKILFQRDRKMSFSKLRECIVIFVSHQEFDFFIIQLAWTACNLVPCSYISNTLKQTAPPLWATLSLPINVTSAQHRAERSQNHGIWTLTFLTSHPKTIKRLGGAVTCMFDFCIHCTSEIFFFFRYCQSFLPSVVLDPHQSNRLYKECQWWFFSPTDTFRKHKVKALRLCLCCIQFNLYCIFNH